MQYQEPISEWAPGDINVMTMRLTCIKCEGWSRTVSVLAALMSSYMYLRRLIYEWALNVLFVSGGVVGTYYVHEKSGMRACKGVGAYRDFMVLYPFP